MPYMAVVDLGIALSEDDHIMDGDLCDDHPLVGACPYYYANFTTAHPTPIMSYQSALGTSSFETGGCSTYTARSHDSDQQC